MKNGPNLGEGSYDIHQSYDNKNAFFYCTVYRLSVKDGAENSLVLVLFPQWERFPCLLCPLPTGSLGPANLNP